MLRVNDGPAQFTEDRQRRENGALYPAFLMTPNKVFRFDPSPRHKAKHLFVFLHGGGTTPESMISVAFRFQARFPSAALVVPNTLEDMPDPGSPGSDPQMLLSDANRVERISAILPRIEDLVRREQTNSGVGAEGTVLIGFSQGGTWRGVVLSRIWRRMRSSSAASSTTPGRSFTNSTTRVSVGFAGGQSWPIATDSSTASIFSTCP